jgi:DNA helicase-2/ATP-dependent DNA helicase PcrA
LEIDSKLVLTTVHKAKGLQYDAVVYVPSVQNNRESHADEITRAILQTRGVDAREELEEEQLRIDFVAFTRAKEHLDIVTDKANLFLNEFSVVCETPHDEYKQLSVSERAKKAFSLFVGGQDVAAHELLDDDSSWLTGFVARHFQALDHVSFSSAKADAFEYLKDRIICLSHATPSANLGSEVHAAARQLASGEECECSKEAEPFVDNVRTLLAQIQAKYPKNAEAELEVKLELSKLTGEDDCGLLFKGYIDAVFANENGEYLIVDWKTDKNDAKSSEHKQQLEAYRHAFATINKIPLEKVKTALAFVGLRPAINTGRIEAVLDEKQPGKTALGTFAKRANTIVSWKRDPKQFFTDLFEKDNNEPLWAALKEQYSLESGA